MASQSEKNVEIGTKVISEINDDAYDLRVESHRSQLECRLSITVKDTENSIAPAELINLLKMLDISESVDLEQLAIFCTEAANGSDPQSFLIATGTEPTVGKDGYFELFVDTGEDEIELQEDESGRVDFKNIQTFTNVEPDQLLGTIYPPEPGTPGKTITGLAIPAVEGRPAKLRAGDGVELRNGGTEVYATKQGRVSMEREILSVVEEFVVSGDVDLKIGHINFNGFVDIKGDVLDDFNIKSTKGINVNGSVGACILESDGPITVGSMAGLGLGKIIAKGDVKARYINQVTIECWGNVFIENEVRNSTVKATGVVSVAKGLITGGRTVALEGVEAKLFGSKSGIKTQITSGVFFPEEDRLGFLRTRLKSIAYQLKKIETSLPALQRKPLDQMRPALREAIELRMKILGDRQVGITSEQEELSKELAAFQSDDHPTANAKINALTSIKEGVVISLGETNFEVKQEINGPVSIIENSQAEGIRQLTMSPLKISAENLEDDALQDAANGS
ncbi:hypothetical protein SAMN02745165_03689 [Malonomonas rubra DSM 5091]|uniref:Flagellar Assembly Protein A N-terminal region domain-containing protein n=1 Tax=Malonomonas rubra DSM 5091 TaxID=1122189 RepID=A0A1M6NRX7_MALRU|nr:FapA family protein [Malonomonas rubra]SHJ98453.1 hypothetical protein SAMN02745165_03689 [Malonomonas rubra DSM 5091]